MKEESGYVVFRGGKEARRGENIRGKEEFEIIFYVFGKESVHSFIWGEKRRGKLKKGQRPS